MPQSAYACLVTENNLMAIRSEAGGKFDPVEAERWLADGQVAYFLRDETSQFDCTFLEETVFMTLYAFESGDASALFRRIKKIH